MGKGEEVGITVRFPRDVYNRLLTSVTSEKIKGRKGWSLNRAIVEAVREKLEREKAAGSRRKR